MLGSHGSEAGLGASLEYPVASLDHCNTGIGYKMVKPLIEIRCINDGEIRAKTGLQGPCRMVQAYSPGCDGGGAHQGFCRRHALVQAGQGERQG